MWPKSSLTQTLLPSRMFNQSQSICSITAMLHIPVPFFTTPQNFPFSDFIIFISSIIVFTSWLSLVLICQHFPQNASRVNTSIAQPEQHHPLVTFGDDQLCIGWNSNLLKLKDYKRRLFFLIALCITIFKHETFNPRRFPRLCHFILKDLELQLAQLEFSNREGMECS